MTQTNPFHMDALMRSGVPCPPQTPVPCHARVQWPGWISQVPVHRRSRRSHMIRDILGDSVLTGHDDSCAKEMPEATPRPFGYLHASSSPAVVKPTPHRLGPPVSAATVLAYRLVASGAPRCSYNLFTPPWLRTDETLDKGEHCFLYKEYSHDL
jgi:hypothetical protein